MTGRRYQLGCVVLLGLCAAPANATDAPVWLRDLEAGKADAKAAGMDMFLLFTGVGWCQPCMVFDRKVLKQPAFLDEARKTFTLIELDCTYGDTPAEKERKSRLESLQKKYLVNGVPTVVLTDAAGMPYGVLTGYEGEVAEMLAWISKARQGRDLRDREFKAASAADGPERVKRLHKGISAVADLLGTLEERQDDAVLVYYKEQVAEIARLDAAGETRKVYDSRRAARDRRETEWAVFGRLDKLYAAKDWRGAVGFIDESLKTVTDRTVRHRLERARISYLELDDRREEALASARRSLGRDGLTADERYEFMFTEARNLFRLGRADEGIALWDRLIAAADSLETRIRRLDWKAQMIPLKTHHDQKMTAWQALRDAAPRGGDEWVNATYQLADDARKAGRPKKALALFHEELAAEASAWTMTQIAECHIDLGEPAKAREWLDRAEGDTAKLKSSPRQGDRQQADQAEKRIKELREKLSKK
jgi:thioredoxin-related protein